MLSFFSHPNPGFTDVISGEGKQCFSVNREDSVESGEKAAVSNNYQGNHAETFYVSDSQMIMTKGRKLSILVVDYQQSIENIFMICSACHYRNE